MKIRFPYIFYSIRNKFRRFVSRNWTGCAYCNEKVTIKLLGGDVDSVDKPVGNAFNTLLDSVPSDGSKLRVASYFYPRARCIEVNFVSKNMKLMPFESIFVNNCPECGRALSSIRFRKKVGCEKVNCEINEQ